MAKTDIIAIVDRSGSMARGWEESREAFIKFLESQKTMEGEATFSLTFFDDEVVQVMLCKPLETISIKDISKIFDDFPPRGTTALNDAICKTILNYDENGADADGRIVLVVTDGGENASEDFTNEDVNKLKDIKEKKVGKWEFVFIGESVQQAASFNIKAVNTIVLDKTSKASMLHSYGNAFSSVTATRAVYNSDISSGT